MQDILQINGLRINFQQNKKLLKAVRGIDLCIRQGETVALVGESGCGKSVSAMSILGLIQSPPGEIASGKIWFKGKDLLTLSEEEIRGIRGKEISMVFQDPLSSLNPVLNIQEQIQEALLTHFHLPEKEVNQLCLDALKKVHIPSPQSSLSKYPHQLSGGQRQRIMIAMALICNPLLLIADEPTTALDVTIQAQVLNLFQEVVSTKERSVLYITHDLSVVANLAQRVYVMYAGLILEQAKTADLFQNPKHPYTKGLLASLPSLNKRGQGLEAVPGSVPDPAHQPSGCPFHPRCRYAQAECRQSLPKLKEYQKDHLSRCSVIN